jgi:predicted nucleic acid-binding protein
MYLLDTNVINEYRKGANANVGVQRFFDETPSKLLFLPVQVTGEIQAGIAKLRRQGADEAKRRAEIYEDWLEQLLLGYRNQLVEFDMQSARLWGLLLSADEKDAHTIDKQIAAMAIIRDMTLVSRDMGGGYRQIYGLKFLNPFA